MQAQPTLKQKRQWKKTILGNSLINKITNPLRNFIEKILPSIDLTKFGERPIEVNNFSYGDPTLSAEFRTHENNLKTISLNVGKKDGYTDMQGIRQARQAIASKFKSKAYNINHNDVYLTSGASLAVWTTVQLLLNDGDNFLFPSPGFPASATIARTINAQPRLYYLSSDNNWQADIKQMESLIDERTRFIYINDPSNPLGSCWSNQHKIEILQLCKRKNIPLLCDEIYQGLTYDTPALSFPELSPSDEITIFKCSGLTKYYLAPGWRMGWIIVYGREDRTQIYNKHIKSILNLILMPNTIMQLSIPTILANQQHDIHVRNCLKIMKANKDLLIEELSQQSYCSFGNISGALYACIVFNSQKLDQIAISTQQFAKALFAQENCIVFPGELFRSERHFIRIVISYSKDFVEDMSIKYKSDILQHMDICIMFYEVNDDINIFSETIAFLSILSNCNSL